jgi:Glycosyl transferase family 2
MSRVCVAISVRNGRDYLAEAIASVLGQGFADLELRVYDNGSSDGSSDIVRTFLEDARVSHTVNEHDLGYYGSLNRALADTGAEFFVPFAADDVMQPANLAAKVELLDATGAGFAHSPVRLIDPHGEPIGELGQQADRAAVYPAPSFFLRCAPVNCITCPSVVARTDALRAIGGFEPRLPYCADWLAWMRLALRHDVAMVHEPLVRWRQHPDSGTAESLHTARYAIEDPAALRAALADPAYPPAWQGLRDPLLAACLTRLATHLERDGHRSPACGPSAVAMAVEALAHAAHEPALCDLVQGLTRAAGLRPASVPFELVAAPGDDPAALAGATALARRLCSGRLLRSLTVTVPEPLLADAAAALERDLTAQGDLDVDLVGAPDAAELLGPGTLAAAVPGSPQAALAELAGRPVAALRWADPLAGGEAAQERAA